MNNEQIYPYIDADGNICEGGFVVAEDAIELFGGDELPTVTVRIFDGDDLVAEIEGVEDETDLSGGLDS